MEHLSNIELFYSAPVNIAGNEVVVEGEEFYHAVKVMRHSTGDEMYIANGEGRIIKGFISEVNKDFLTVGIESELEFKKKFPGVVFCIPKLKSPERFEFALEKCTEMGITEFIVFESERTISKSSKIERWNKIVLSAMKQSLQCFLPSISMAGSIKEIAGMPGKKIVFEQNTENIFQGKVKVGKDKSFFFFGPEGGLSEKELSLFSQDELYKLADNRLRSETAIIKCAALLH